jgi:hypothetical protein
MVDLYYLIIIVLCLENLLYRLELCSLVADSEQRTSGRQDRSTVECSKFQLSLSIDFTSAEHSGISDKQLSFFASRWQGTSGYVFEHFDDGLESDSIYCFA